MAIANDNNSVTAEVLGRQSAFRVADPTKGAFFWLAGFFVVYCARPEDWIPGLRYLPLAKITAIFAMWGLFTSFGRTKRTIKDLPKEAKLLLIMIGLLFLGGFLSPVWRGGAVTRTIDFSKIYIAWVLVFLLITTFDRLRSIIFIQVASVVLACGAALVKGHDVPRLNAVLGGIYSNPNDLAFAIVLSMPFALAFMVTAKNAFVKVMWLSGMLVMLVTIFLTASRAMEQSQEGERWGGGHGVFTWYLVEGLRKAAWEAYLAPILEERGQVMDMLDEIAGSSAHSSELQQIRDALVKAGDEDPANSRFGHFLLR